MATILTLNPKRRSRKAKKSRKHRTAAQRAATRRLVALNKGRTLRRNPAKAASARRKSRRKSVSAAPSRRRRSSRFASARAYGMNNVVPLLKNGAIGGAGAIANDILYGQAGRILPASMMSPVNADGSTNWVYFAGKAAMAVGIGILGRKVPVVGPHAGRMAEGAMTVLAYQVGRGMVASMLPASVTLAAYNPVPLVAPRRNASGTMGAYVPTRRQLGAYVNTNNVMPMQAPRRSLA